MTEKVSKEGEKNTSPETGGESEEGEEEEKLEENGVHELSKNEVPDHSCSEENKDEFEDEPEQEIKGKRGSKKLSAKKEHAGMAKTKKVATPKKSPPTGRTPLKSSSKHSEVDDKSDASPKTSGKKRTDKKTKTKEVETSKKSSPPPKIAKSSSQLSEVDDRSDAKSPKTFSRKKKTEVVKEKSSAPKKTFSMEKTGNTHFLFSLHTLYLYSAHQKF